MLQTIMEYITTTPTDYQTAICTACVCAVLVSVVFTMWEFISNIIISILERRK